MLACLADIYSIFYIIVKIPDENAVEQFDFARVVELVLRIVYLGYEGSSLSMILLQYRKFW
jgi:hypothetical protein